MPMESSRRTTPLSTAPRSIPAGWVAALAVLSVVAVMAPSPVAAAAESSDADCRVVPIASEHRELTEPAASVERLYRALFLRRPDRAGLGYWTATLNRGDADLGAVAEYFASSPEFANRYGRLSDDRFVDLLYCNVMGRHDDDSGSAYWRSQLRTGLTRAAAVLHFSQSAEFVARSSAPPAPTTIPDAPPSPPTTTAPSPAPPTPPGGEPATPPPPPTDDPGGDDSPGPTLVWAEEFDTFDSSVWRREHSTYGDGNGELQCYRPENVSVRDGALILRAKVETYTCPNGSTRQVTSGMVRGTVDFDHGQRIEFRVKVNPRDPDDQRGLWPALWASSWNGGGWPRGGEVDWLEYVGKDPTRAHHTIHYLDPDGRRAKMPKAVDLDERFSDSWHVVAFDWTDDLVWYLDGREVQRITAAEVNALDNPFLESSNSITQIKLNLALGGSWGGALGPTTVDAAGTTNFAVDYVRIYNL